MTASIDPEMVLYLEEACYYLRKNGLTFPELAKALEISETEAVRLFEQYTSKIASGAAIEDEVDKNLWEDIHNDSFGNEKITFARENGFYHCRRSDLELMESSALMSIFESSKKFLDFDMYKPFLDTKPPVGYDPMALQRQVKRAIELVQEILKTRWENGSTDSKKDNRKNNSQTE